MIARRGAAGCALLASLAGAAFAAPATPSPGDAFLAQVTAHFAAWDRDRDGTFSAAEIDAAFTDPKIAGPEAAAVAAIKRAVRTKKLHLPPLTAASLRDLTAAAPAPDRPDFAEMFAAALKKVPNGEPVLFTAGTPKLAGLRQGKLGDCFCLAPMGALVARDPAAVAARFARQPDGSYRVTLGRETVSVPAPTAAEIALAASTGGQGMWLNVYEKAVGTTRLHGTGVGKETAGGKGAEPAEAAAETTTPLDAVSRGGSAGTMLSMLTGHRIFRIGCRFARDPKVTPAERDEKLKALRAALTAAVHDRRLMTCGTEKTTTPGITPNHGYAVLGYDPDTDAVRLWNPHGDDFTPRGAPGLANGYPRRDGVFSIPLTDLLQQFAGFAFETTEPVTEGQSREIAAPGGA